MKAIVIQGAFGLDSLTQVDLPDPVPQRDEVVIRMRAASLNYRDLMVVMGTYNPRQPLPLVPFSDGVGEVVAIGPEVTRVKIGDRVCPIFAQGWLEGEATMAKLKTTLGAPLNGVLSELFLTRETGLVKPPSFLTDAEAATLPCAGLTAYNALLGTGDLRAGETVLIQGTGGVSIFALQCAKMAGPRASGAGRSFGSALQSTSSFLTLASVIEMSSPSNARRPASISYSTTPNAQMSARLSTARPRACSGAMYAAVPMIIPICVALAVIVGEFIASTLDEAAGSIAFARPKSSTFTVPSARTLMFCGFRSR